MHEIDILIFQGSPQTFRKNVVHAPSPTIHTDINPIILEHSGKSVAGELGSLVGIEYFRFSKLKSHFQRLQTECRIQGRGCLPGKDIAAPPVRNGHQIHESSGKRNVGYIGSPNLILSIYADVPQQVRINLVLRMRLAQMGLRIDGLQAHFPHQPLNMLSVDRMFVPSQMSSHLPGTVKRRKGVLLVNQTLQQKVIFIHHRRIVNTGSGYAQKIHLMADGYLSIRPVNEQQLLFMA